MRLTSAGRAEQSGGNRRAYERPDAKGESEGVRHSDNRGMRAAPMLATAMTALAALACGPVQAHAQESAQDTPYVAARAAGYGEVSGWPDFTGVWAPDWSLLFGSEGRRPVEPVLTPAAQERFAAFQARQEAEGVDQSAQVQCLPPGMPGIMRQPYPIEFLFSPGRVTILTETYSQARRIHVDGRVLPDDPDFLFNGTSVGRWDGDVLHVDSTGFSPLVRIAPGIDHSGNMRISERIWLQGPDVLRIETTITDPQVLAEPLVQQLAFKREPAWDIREYVCAENNRLVDDAGGANIDLGLDDEGDPFGPPTVGE